MRTVAVVILRELLQEHGITTIKEFSKRLAVPKQYAWLLWHGKIALSTEMIRRLHQTLHIPLEQLILVERATPAKRRGRKPKGQPRKRPPEA